MVKISRTEKANEREGKRKGTLDFKLTAYFGPLNCFLKILYLLYYTYTSELEQHKLAAVLNYLLEKRFELFCLSLFYVYNIVEQLDFDSV